MDELAELREKARDENSYRARDALDALADAGDKSPEMLELLVDLMGSAHPQIAEHALDAIKAIGPDAIAVVIERIGRPRSPTDHVLLDRSVTLGSQLLPLARILVSDADPERARSAARIVATDLDALGVDQALDLYLIALGRCGDSGMNGELASDMDDMASVLERLLPRLRTQPMRDAIAARWYARDLRAWIEDRLGTTPRTDGMLLALLIVGPEDMTPVIHTTLHASSDRLAAVEPMLWGDHERTAAVLRCDPDLEAWAEREAIAVLSTMTDQRASALFAFTMSDSPAVIDVMLGSPIAGRRDLGLVRWIAFFKPPGLRAVLEAGVGRGVYVNEGTLAALLAALDS